MTQRVNVHATGIVLDGAGVLLRGPSGSGKSLLALVLLEWWQQGGRPAALVGDDRLDLEVEAGGLVMAAAPALAGLIELRGRGIVSRPHLRRAAVTLVVDLVPELERMPEPHDLWTTLLGIVLPRCPVPRAGVIETTHQRLLVAEALRAAAAESAQEIT